MDEQSHKDEMRAALRGDFERMRRRQAGEIVDAPESYAPPPPPIRVEPGFDRQDVSAGSWFNRLLRRD